MVDQTQSRAGRIEVSASHRALVGRFEVRRALPQRGRRTVGPWCFADHMGPAAVTDDQGLDIGPHPHCGLQTVTWLVEGEALHHDSLGTEQLITPGRLNLMTAGRGVAHAEEATGHYRGVLEGVQLWIAQPESTRHGAPAFDHLADLEQVELTGGSATLLAGEFAGVTSAARVASPVIGLDLSLTRDTIVALSPSFEHAIIPVRGAVTVDGARLEPGALGYLPPGTDELAIRVHEPTRALLVGGEPFAEQVLMWWNFVARTRDEIDAAYGSWAHPDGRFGEVLSQLDVVTTAPPYWQSPTPKA